MITRKQFKIAVIALVALYALIFALRTAYVLVANEEPVAGGAIFYTASPYDSSLNGGYRMASNVASLRKEYVVESGIEVLDQKYERIASVSTRTVSYGQDLAKLDDAIEQSQAVVQMENAQGLEGSRTLSRVIGVKPQHFDSCLAAIQEIGMLVSSTTQKNDKTYEYNQMLAQKQELEKRIESYTALRSHGGSINELLNLEDKIIEVESQLLMQAVNLGEYSDDNALCTINVSLYEWNPTAVARRIWDAFVWTNKCYFAILGGCILLCLAAVVLVKSYIFLSKALSSDKKAIGGKADAGKADAGKADAGKPDAGK